MYSTVDQCFLFQGNFLLGAKSKEILDASRNFFKEFQKFMECLRKFEGKKTMKVLENSGSSKISY